MSAPDFWDNPEAARALMNEVNPLKRRLEQFRSLENGLEDVEVAVEMAGEDPDMAPEAEFLTDEKVVDVYAWCNLHGLWKATL